MSPRGLFRAISINIIVNLSNIAHNVPEPDLSRCIESAHTHQIVPVFSHLGASDTALRLLDKCSRDSIVGIRVRRAG